MHLLRLDFHMATISWMEGGGLFGDGGARAGAGEHRFVNEGPLTVGMAVVYE